MTQDAVRWLALLWHCFTRRQQQLKQLKRAVHSCRSCRLSAHAVLAAALAVLFTGLCSRVQCAGQATVHTHDPQHGRLHALLTHAQPRAPVDATMDEFLRGCAFSAAEYQQWPQAPEWHTASRACDILGRYDSLLMMGDSLTRQVSSALLLRPAAGQEEGLRRPARSCSRACSSCCARTWRRARCATTCRPSTLPSAPATSTTRTAACSPRPGRAPWPGWMARRWCARSQARQALPACGCCHWC